ncbi:MAG: ribosomal L7Ae/L30e/S12e/Gadd45 family protein [Clostridia bacterium]|nr:ribosomal L7Ae/L30e/S12e/Gadd45 family protein [Clostridia bacterium]
MLGLAKRAGKLAAGTPAVTAEVRAHKALLVLLTSDAAPNAVKRITDSCASHSTPLITVRYTKSEIGAAIGQSGEVAAAALLDHNFKKAILTILETDMTEAGNTYPQEVQ